MPREDPLFAALKQRIVEAGYTVVTPAEAAERLFAQLDLRLLDMFLAEGGLVLDRAVMRLARQLAEMEPDRAAHEIATTDGLAETMATPSDVRHVARALGMKLQKERFEKPSILRGDTNR